MFPNVRSPSATPSTRDPRHASQERSAPSAHKTTSSGSPHPVSGVVAKAGAGQVFATGASDPASEGPNEDLFTLIQQKYRDRVGFSATSPTEFTQPVIAWNRDSRRHPYGLAVSEHGDTRKYRFATIEKFERALDRLKIQPQAPQAAVRRSPKAMPELAAVVEKPRYAGIDHEAQNLAEKVQRRFEDVFPFDKVAQSASRSCPVRFSSGEDGGVMVHIHGHRSREVRGMDQLEARLARCGITAHMSPTQALAHQLERCGASPECVASDGKPTRAPDTSTIWYSNSHIGKYGVWAKGAAHPVLAGSLIEAIQIARRHIITIRL